MVVIKTDGIMGRAFFRIVRPMVRQLGIENIRKGYDLYLNNYPASYYLGVLQLFREIGKYLGHGLCYESAALEMFLWHDYPEYPQRIVYGRCLKDGEMVDHCWFEIKRFGIWWAIDPAWNEIACPQPVPWHNSLSDVVSARSRSYDWFWSHELFQQMHERMKDPRTSYVFHEFALTRISHDYYPLLILDVMARNAPHVVDLSNRETTGITPELSYIYGVDRPVTQQLINELVNSKAPS